jgi:regulator of sigma E protease
MLYDLRAALAYAFDIGMLVFFHELGHYLAARSQGVTVETFSIGFGPALLSWRSKKTGTVWKLSALPIGGYVKMQGWGESAGAASTQPGSFAATRLGSKALIVAAGPLANLLLAFVLFIGLFAVDGQPVVKPVITEVIAGSAAAGAGLRPGDVITSIDGHEIHQFDDMVGIIADHPDAALRFTYSRAGQPREAEITLGETTADGRMVGSLGVGGDDVSLQPLSLPGAVRAAGAATWSGITMTLQGLYNLIVHQQGLHQLRGMIGIAQITGQVAAFGLPSLINLIALLSINLGLVNLVPIPILDGGHLLFYAGEAIFRRPIPPRAQDIFMRFGGALLISLIVFTTLNDLNRLGAASWIAHLLG